MKLAARILFAVSLAANGVALYLLPTEPVPPIEAPPAALVAPLPPSAVARAAGDVHSYREALLARGLTLEETKPLVLAWLTAESVRASPGRAADAYWQSGYVVAAVETVRARVAAADRVRTLLLELYGPQARADAVFAPLFEPLDARHAFLASEQQVALQKFQLERQLAQAKGGPVRPAPDGPGAARTSVTADLLQQLTPRLGQQAALQYLYRFSPLADQLRAADLELSDAEFRRAFDTLLAFEGAAADPHTFAQTRGALRSALGDVRFTRLWAARDPFFGAIAAAGRQRGLAEAAILAAYGIFNDTQDRLAATADRYAGVDPERAGAELHRIQQDMQQRLAGLVGEEAAEALVRAVARLSISMQPTSSTNLRE